MKLLDRIGRRGTIVMAISAAVIAMALQPFLGTDAWAGLGQWAGGLGAFFAAWAALRIARMETHRQHEQEAHRMKVQAYYVSAEWNDGPSAPQPYRAIVKNLSSEPVTDVRLVAVHRQGVELASIGAVEGRLPVLLPDDHWNPEVLQGVRWADGPGLGYQADPEHEIEIAFEDLGGTTWRRIGRRPPTVDETA